VAEWLRSPPLKQCQSDREGPGSIPGAGKLDLGFQFGRKNEYQLIKLGLKWGLRFALIHLADRIMSEYSIYARSFLSGARVQRAPQ